MRTRRKPGLGVALSDLGFAIAAFGCGLYNTPLWLTGLAAFVMLAYWTWTRRAALHRLRSAVWVSPSTLAVAMLFAILGGAYWLGLGMGGTF
jgi:hypothetical protein